MIYTLINLDTIVPAAYTKVCMININLLINIMIIIHSLMACN